MKLLAGAILFCVGSVMATSAMSTNLAGGGATLPAGAYVGFDFINKPTTGDSAKLSQGPVDSSFSTPSYGANVLSNSLFGAWATTNNVKISYCQTGSGAGKRFLNGDSTGTLTATGTCGPNSGTPALAGFDISATKFPSSQNPDFIASDAPLSQAEYTTFVNNKAAHVEPTQFPALVGSIAIIYNIPGLTARLDLTESQVCQVFSGKAATWGAVTPALKDVNGNTVTLPNPSLPIKIAFRSDGSGTSFNFSNHLAANCGSADVVGGHFDTDQTWSAASPATSVIKDLIGFPTSSSVLLPSNGNPAVVAAVAANSGAVGYAEEANVLAAPSSSVQTAKITGKDPAADLVTTFNAPAGSVVADQAITGISATGTPTLAALTSVPGQASCVAVVNPNSYAKGVTAGAGYPIVAVTYLMANSRGNATNVATLRSFLLNPYGAHTGVTTVGTGTGFAFLGNAGITAARVNACIQ
ncbi:substrate-binding domain-containing protein [Dyella sp.]|uniref:substrate-binding domain-containing protein n=1 Tax=Dyella sp. TaxID=1869338 RepID=UPI002ED2A789